MSEVVEARGLTFIQRRKMGLTFGNCLRVARQLKKDGTLSEDDDVAAAQIAAELAKENPKGFEGTTAIDWDAILAFIEKLLPLIMQIISMFAII